MPFKSCRHGCLQEILVQADYSKPFVLRTNAEREALAVVWAVQRLKAYIEGHEVIIGNDHQPLKCFFTLKSPSGRLV